MQKNRIKKSSPTFRSNLLLARDSQKNPRLSLLTLSLWQAYASGGRKTIKNFGTKFGIKVGIAMVATGVLIQPVAMAQILSDSIAPVVNTPSSVDVLPDTAVTAPDTSELLNTSLDSAPAAAQDNETTLQIAMPVILPNSARTRPNFTPSQKQQASLERLKQYYQKNSTASQTQVIQPTDNTINDSNTNASNNLTATNTPDSDVIDLNPNRLNNVSRPPMCYGNWVYPQTSNANTPDEYKQNAIHAAQSNQPNNAFPLYAQADYGYYDNDNYAELAGNVFVNQGRQQIAADKVVVNLQAGVASAQGNVMLVDAADSQSTVNNTISNAKAKGGLITVADEIAYETDSSKATAKDVAFASVPLQAHGYAKQLNKVDESRYEIDDVMFTTCSPENPEWQINAKNIDINTDTGRGEAYNATFKIKNKPVLYVPYFNFPIDSRRTSGFLLPRLGFASDGGFNLETPYYFNLASNYDATLTPSIYTNRNPMLTGEFRYLTNGYGEGNLTASYLPKDKQYDDKDRDSVFFNHFWQSDSIPNLTAEAVYQHVSDSSYFNDFDTLGSFNSRLNLPHRIQANYFNDYVTALAKVEEFQTLSSKLTNDEQVLDKDKPYKRLPQLSVRYRVPQDKLPWELPIQVTGVSDFAYFKRPIDDGSALEQSGGRLYNKLTATYPMTRPWGYVTPSVSLQHLYTQFDEATTLANNIDKNNKSESIFVPEFSLDSGLNFYKAGSPRGKFADGGYQLISPRLKYVYAPYRDQSSVPNFNTRLASLNFPQIYENSWFLGYDRLADSNQLTPSFNYRYVDGNGLTRLDASIGQQFYLGDIKVHLDNTNNPIKLDSSGTVLQLSSQPKQNFWMDLDGAVTDSGSLGYVNTQLRYMPNNESLYNLGYIKRNSNPLGQKDLSAITASAIFPLSDIFAIDTHWRFLGAVQFDNERSRFSDVLAGFTYDSCCYGFSIYGRSYYNDLDTKDEPNRAIMAEISLNGIANKRQGRLSNLISERVLGFKDINGF